MAVREAIILAAGLGSRIPSRTRLKPKGFIEVDGVPIVRRSLDNLADAGIRRVVLGTGHLAGCYEELAREYSALAIELVANPHYADSGSLETFLLCCERVSGPFLSLESDLVYHPALLTRLLETGHDHTLLVSGPTASGDEVYASATPAGRLLNLSKRRGDMVDVYGEFTGLCRFDGALPGAIRAWLGRQGAPRPTRLEYEAGLVGISGQLPLLLEKVDLPWGEIDTLEHLARVEQSVWPAIKGAAVLECRETAE